MRNNIKEMLPFVLGITALLFTLLLIAIFREPVKNKTYVTKIYMDDPAFTLWNLHVRYWEGGYADSTNMGVTYSTYRILCQNLGLDCDYSTFLTMTEEQHKTIMLYHWKAVGADTIKDKRIGAFLAEELWASGTISMYDSERNYEILLALKRNKYKHLCAKYPKYCKGWHRRNESFEETFKILK